MKHSHICLTVILLSLLISSSAHQAWALAPGNRISSALAITPGRYSSVLSSGSHFYKIDVQKGSTISIYLQVPEYANYDVYLHLPESIEGDMKTAAYSAQEGTDVDESIQYIAQVSGFYFIEVRGYSFTAAGLYELDVYITSFRATSAQWGTSSTPVEAAPGDQNVPLNIMVRNDANLTAYSLSATLELGPYFTSATKRSTAISYYDASLRSGQSATFTYTLNISPDIPLGEHQLNLTVGYQMASGSELLQGISVKIPVNLLVNGKVSLDISANTSSLKPGYTNTATLILKNTGSGAASSIDLTFTPPSTLSLIGVDNHWFFPYIGPGESLSIQMALYVPPTETSTAIQSTASINYRDAYGNLRAVSRVIGFNILPSENPIVEVRAEASTLLPGVVNDITLSIRNLGSSTIHDLEVVFSPPSGMTIIGGSNSLYFQKLEGYGVIRTPILLYAASSAAGSVMQLQASISYRKSDGSIQSLTRTIGFKITVDTSGFLRVSQNVSSVVSNIVSELRIVVTNTRSQPIHSLSISISAPSPAIILSGDKQTYPKVLPPNADTSFAITLLVPQGFQGSSLQLQLTLTYLDEREVTYTESGVIGLAVKGLAWMNPISISLDDNILTAGIVNNREIKITNIGGTPIHSVVTTVSIPSGAATLVSLMGQNRWFSESIPAKGSITISPKIFAAPTSVDNIYVIQIDVSYEDSSGIPHTETQSISLVVQGLIFIQVQDVETSPSRIVPGDNVTIMGNLLNRGNVPAMYAAVDARSKSPYISGGTQYIGQVDTNVITPFSVVAQVDRRAQNGTYPITITISYSDDYNKTRSISSSTNVVVGGSQDRGAATRPTQQTLIGGMTQIGLVFFTGISLTIIATIAVFWRNRRTMRRKSTLEPMGSTRIKTLASSGRRTGIWSLAYGLEATEVRINA